MVKMIFIIIVAVLIAIPSLLSCASSTQTFTSVPGDNQSASAAPPEANVPATQKKPLAPLTESVKTLDVADTQVLLQHIGQEVNVKGKVVQFNTVYDDNKRPLILQFTPYDLTYDDWQKSQAGSYFKALLYKENNSEFPFMDECYQQNITIKGVIELFKSSPAIVLKKSGQLQITDNPPVKKDLPPDLKGTEILYVSDRDSFVDPLQWGYDGQGEIYKMNADGGNTVRLTDSGGRNRCPEWSPDKTKIAFMSDRDSIINYGWDIYVMNSDGSGVVRLTKNHARNWNPKWSHDGNKITFGSDFGSANTFQIYTMNADGSGIKQVTFTPRPSSCYGPSFGVEDREIIFGSNNAGSWGIYKVDLATGNITNLTQISNRESAWPVISPDEQKIVYYRDDGVSIDLMNPNYKIHIMNVDGTNDKCISFDAPDEMIVADYYPSWSPDGTKIVFTSNRSPGLWKRNTTTTRRLWVSQTYVMDADGSNMYRIPYVFGNNWFPSWK